MTEACLSPKERRLVAIAKSRGYIMRRDSYLFYSKKDNALYALKRLELLGIVKQSTENPERYDYQQQNDPQTTLWLQRI
jgi:hypothetical protein